MTALYTSGTISLVNGSAVITGIDTAWKTALIVGGTVHVEAEGNPLPILPDDSAGASEHPITDTEMTAAIKWQGATGTYKYALVRENTYTEAQAANSVKIAELLQRLNHPTIAAIAGVQGEQDHLILLTGASTATIIPRTSLIQGIEANATVETPAGLVTYESEAAGFIVLVSNAGDQRAALYFKVSATAGDWSDPAFLTGEKGDQGNIGPTGIRWAGVWNNVDAYAKNDVVRNNKSAWIALRANTNVAPPVLPTEANDDWELFARAGVDGTGVGDVVGPENAIAGDFVQFSGNTGKEIGTAQMGSPALVGRVSAGVGPVERLTVAQVRAAIGIRDILTENRNYYVRAGGNNANAGTENTDAGAWATLQYAYDFIANKLDLNGFDVTINMADGYHAAPLTVAKRLLGNNRVFIRGNVANPANCFLEVTNNNCIVNSCPGFTVNVGGVRFSALNVGSCLFANGGDIQLGANCLFAGALGGDHFIAINGGTISITANYTVAGGCVNHWHAYGFGQIICQNVTITISAPIGVTRWCGVATGLLTSTGCTFTNKANVAGATYLVHRNGCVIVEGAGATYFPGTAAGTVATGGQYV
ncbi:hypothetical protein CFBP5877_18825 [Agrobacterium tumefaciens]|uniref:Uncharacterized protein n=1 Tax=Agrobacterium tumefaciens TaxID=358 RepID=A0AAE6EGV1_AGRTU|nr:hypothetical protein [Agrobacterium tumefaciens]QCL81197.1 hypothetical protein CFBP5877_18825 [Agrobacterium tumefaciens]